MLPFSHLNYKYTHPVKIRERKQDITLFSVKHSNDFRVQSLQYIRHQFTYNGGQTLVCSQATVNSSSLKTEAGQQERLWLSSAGKALRTKTTTALSHEWLRASAVILWAVRSKRNERQPMQNIRKLWTRSHSSWVCARHTKAATGKQDRLKRSSPHSARAHL